MALNGVVSNSETDFSIASSVQHGYAQSTVDVQFAVKVEAAGLAPYTKYYYRFESCEGADLGVSPVGIFKTLPAEDDDVTSLRLAFFSCSNLPFGYFNAYGAAANHSETLDYVQHLGDYIYEYKNGGIQPHFSACCHLNSIKLFSKTMETEPRLEGWHSPTEKFPVFKTIASEWLIYLRLYLEASTDRTRPNSRYASILVNQYRMDPDLQELHRVLAWQTVWDDHEIADNTWAHGSANSNDTIYGQIGDYQFSARKANAVRAYFEWMPIRQVDTDDKLRIWRSFKLGKLADMTMLDTRVYQRSETDLYYNTDIIEAEADSPDRTITGPSQESWFFDQLTDSTERNATWRLVMQQVVFSRINYTLATGGSYEFNEDAWEDIGVAEKLVAASPVLQYAEGQLRGYVELSITPNNVTADYFGFLTRNSNVTHMGSFTTTKNSNKLDRPLNGGKKVAFGALGRGAA
ncbi:alkaline phosphatase D, partial [Phenoliferia sp. Uapishka_3]